MKRFEPINTIRGPCFVLEQDNVDTDQIIPARFLYRSRKEGFEGLLFHDFLTSTTQDLSFSAQQCHDIRLAPKVLLAGENFGCGSSREHAVWALLDSGFRAIIAKGFGDIFYANATNNGLLLIQLDHQWVQLKDDVSRQPVVTVDLPHQRVLEASGHAYAFEIEPFFKNMLTSGIQEIDMTLDRADKIRAFEQKQVGRSPWLQCPPRAISTRRQSNEP